MKKHIYTFGLLLQGVIAAHAQNKIKDGSVTGTSSLPNANAILELESNNKGLMLPKVALSDTSLSAPMSAHIKGMVVYDTASVPLKGINPGFYYNDGGKWIALTQSKSTAWLTTGNSATNSGLNMIGSTADGNYVGTTDTAKLVLSVNKIKRLILDTMGNMHVGRANLYSSSNLHTILAGEENAIDSEEASIITGYRNTSTGYAAATNILGGQSNVLKNSVSQFVSGYGNQITLANNGIVSGANNVQSIVNGTAVFGRNHRVTGVTGFGSDYNILSGDGNVIYTDNVTSFATNNAVFGNANKDSASYTLMAGQNNTILHTGSGAMVFGSNNVAGGDHSLVGGTNNVSNQQSEIIVGGSNISYPGLGGNAIFGGANTMGTTTSERIGANMIGGYGNTINDGVDEFIFGQSCSIIAKPGSLGTSDFVGGFNNKITAVGSSGSGAAGGFGMNTVFGANNTVTATSTNYGSYQNLVSGSSNTVRGYANIVTGGSNGGNTISAGGENCAMFGKSNTINNAASNVMVTGAGNTANSNIQFIAGQGLTANTSGEIVVGSYNTPLTNGLFTVGNGTSAAQKNAFVVLQDGKVVAAQIPSYATDAAADADTSLPTGGLYKLNGSRAIYQKP